MIDYKARELSANAFQPVTTSFTSDVLDRVGQRVVQQMPEAWTLACRVRNTHSDSCLESSAGGIQEREHREGNRQGRQAGDRTSEGRRKDCVFGIGGGAAPQRTPGGNLQVSTFEPMDVRATICNVAV